jgi:Predicted membrane protein (DUF2157)
MPTVRQADEAQDEAADAHLQPRAVVVCRKPVTSESKHDRHQPEDCRPNGDDGQTVDVGRRHGCLHQEVVVLGRLVHINHLSAVRTQHGLCAGTARLNESRLVSRQDVVVNRLETQLARLVEQQVISAAQATELVEAARADRLAGQLAPDESVLRSMPKGSAVLEVLGYVGGALVLGAVIMLGAFFWDDLGSTGRKLVAVASLVVPALGGAALIKGGARPELGRILLALACYAAGFAYLVVFDDQKFVVSAALVVATSAVGAVLLRSGAFLVSGWSGAMLLVCAVVFNVIDVAEASPAEASSPAEAVPVHLAIGFLLVGLALAASGLMLSRTLAWSLAGLSGWAASIVLQMDPPYGEWVSLVVASVISAALLTAFVMTRRYVYAVIGCVILLSIWPVSLYRILDDAVGAALGLVAAGAVLIGTVIVLSHRRRISTTA